MINAIVSGFIPTHRRCGIRQHQGFERNKGRKRLGIFPDSGEILLLSDRFTWHG